MVTIQTHPDHAISWVDLATPDLDGAVEFYSGLFGWTSFNDGTTPYTIFLVDEHPVGGVMAISPEMAGMPPVWSTYVAVENAAATIEAVSGAGGSVFREPFEIPNGGRIAVVADPAGAAICLFEGSNHNGLKLMDEPGAPCWFDCLSRDAESARVFYETVFGWESQAMDAGGMTYHLFLRDGQPTCGVMAMPPVMPADVPSHWVVDFSIADVDVAAQYVQGNGGRITQPPMDTPFGRSCGVADTWGASFMMIDRSAAMGEG